ncbi:unnamed protein product [Heterobilharzia americana]|nr:unnamed protein product [Heterobilharzia americana]CAH8584134.1 unnamed protein product [Heterobilharzia americana]
MEYKFITIYLKILSTFLIHYFFICFGCNLLISCGIIVSFSSVTSGNWMFDLLTLSGVKKLNSPSYIRDRYFGHIKDYTELNNLIRSSNFVNQPGRKSIRASGSQVFDQQRTFMSQNKNTLKPFGYYDEISHANNYAEESVQQLLPFGNIISSDADFSVHETGICHALTGLTNRQRYICLQHSGLIWAMLEGTHLGMHECVHQFRHEQWNCSAVNLLYRLHTKSKKLPSIHGLEGILQRGSRETAFLSSSWSAGVVQAITRACSQGQMGTCDCDPHRREGQGRDAEGIFTWGGCSDPIRFGMRLARLFLDANDEEHRSAALQRERELHEQRIQLLSSMRSDSSEQRDRMSRRIYRFSRSLNGTAIRQQPSSNRGEENNSASQENKPDILLSSKELQEEILQIIQTKARTLMNLHNRKAGRRLVWKNRVTKCKCHGVSGACSMRTCWQRVNEFRLVGKVLKSAYDSAIRVTYEPRLDILKRIDTKMQIQKFSQSHSYPIKKNLPAVSTNLKHDSKNWLIVINNHSNSGVKQDRNGFLSNKKSQHRWPRMTIVKSRELPKNKLVYLEESPNYCYFDESIGHLGIAGRQCNATSKDAVNSCSRLCCDRGYDTLEFESEQKCECKFFWCCEVRCNICRERTVTHHCKH